MKILIAIPCLLNGGTERQTLSLSSVLRSCSHVVEILCYFEYDTEILNEFNKTEVNVKLLNLDRKLGFLELILRLEKEIRLISPDVVHVQYMAPGALPIIAVKLAGVKHVFATVHQPYTKSHGRLAKLILKIASLLTTKFIAVSQNAELSWFGCSHLFDENFPSRRQQSHATIHNSIDVKLIQRTIAAVDVKELKEMLSIQEDVPVIGAISRLRYEKGIDLLIEAFNNLAREGAQAHLLIVGSGPDENLLKQRVEDYGLGSRVTFYGEAEWGRAMQLMGIMDMVIVPSRFEGFGLTAAEAMAAGKPVVASDSTGLKEVINDGETGILFPVDDVSALVNALQKLIMDLDLRHRFGSAAEKRIKEHFSLEIFTRKIQALYSHYLSGVSLFFITSYYLLLTN